MTTPPLTWCPKGLTLLRMEFDVLGEGKFESFHVFLIRNFYSPQTFQVSRQELTLQQGETSFDQMLYKGMEGDFGSIRLSMKHRLSEKGTSEADSV